MKEAILLRRGQGPTQQDLDLEEIEQYDATWATTRPLGRMTSWLQRTRAALALRAIVATEIEKFRKVIAEPLARRARIAANNPRVRYALALVAFVATIGLIF